MSKDQKQTFYVLGMSDNEQPQFSNELVELISQSQCFSGGARHREIVAELLPAQHEWIEITVPLDEVFAQYEGKEQVLVFASGDPLFYGFANTLLQRLPDAQIKVYPYFNSIQMLAHALLIPYQDMHIVSLTGRPWHELDRALIERKKKIALLTDRKHTPSAIAERLLHYGYKNYRMHIGCRLGNKAEEEVHTLDLHEVVGKEFPFPNSLFLIDNNRQELAAAMGLRDEDFMPLNGRQRMITKWPIRLSSIALLDLHRAQEFWDVGFCTGSVSIEAKLRFPHLHVRAFEIRPEGDELMQENSQRMQSPGIDYRIGDFLEQDLSELPPCDAVFVGGHGGKMPQLIEKLAKHLSHEACIVFNAVSEASKASFVNSAEEQGLRISECIEMRVDDYNPIQILKAVKGKDRL